MVISTAPRTAVYVDSENQPHARILEWVREASQDPALGGRLGTLEIKKAFAGWKKANLRSLKGGLIDSGFELIDVPAANRNAKSAADVALAMGAVLDMATRTEIESVVIVSGDGDLAPLATHLRSLGKWVLGLSLEDKAKDTLIDACDAFRPIGIGSKPKVSLVATRQAPTTPWAEGVRKVVFGALEVTAPIGLIAVNHGLRQHFGVQKLADALPFGYRRKIASAVADGLVGTNLVMYRLPDDLGDWLIGPSDSVPSGAERKVRRDEYLLEDGVLGGSTGTEDEELDVAAPRIVIWEDAVLGSR